MVLISNFGLGLDYVLMALAPNLWWLFAGRVISGISAATIATSYAYVTDVTPAEQRAAKFGMLGAAFGLGFVLGPALGGVLGAIDPRMPFWVAAGSSLLNGLYGLLVLPESLPREKRIAFEWRRANPVGSLNFLRSHPELSGLAVAEFLAALAHVVLPSVWVLYAGYRYGWDERAVGLSLAVVGVCAVDRAGRAGRAGGEGARRAPRADVRARRRRRGFHGVRPCRNRTGVLSRDSAARAVGHRQSGDQQPDDARMSEPSEQGQLQGANSSIQGIANLAGPFVFTLTFAWSIGGGKDAHCSRRGVRPCGGDAGRRGGDRVARDAPARLTD